MAVEPATQVIEALAALHGTNDATSKEQANNWLENFQKTVGFLSWSSLLSYWSFLSLSRRFCRCSGPAVALHSRSSPLTVFLCLPLPSSAEISPTRGRRQMRCFVLKLYR